MSREMITVDIRVRAVLNVDQENWPEDWDLKKEATHQVSFEDAQAWHVLEVTEVRRQAIAQILEPGTITVTIEE